MNVPSLKRIPSHAPSAGQSAAVAFVSGPRNVRRVLPLWRVTAISKLAAAIDTNEPPRSLRERQTLSMNGESDGLSSKLRNILPLSYPLAARGSAGVSSGRTHKYRE